PFPLAFEEGPVVERGSVQLPTIEVLPELDVLHIVQGYLQTHHLCRGIGPGRLCRKRRRPSLLGQVLPLSRSDLLGITYIHDGPHTCLVLGLPPSFGDEAQIGGPDEGTSSDGTPILRRRWARRPRPKSPPGQEGPRSLFSPQERNRQEILLNRHFPSWRTDVRPPLSIDPRSQRC